jgi:hypothetical protein
LIRFRSLSPCILRPDYFALSHNLEKSATHLDQSKENPMSEKTLAEVTPSLSPPTATPSFGIPEKTGYYENGVTWTAQTGRHAHIYVFAYHPLVDEATDHRNAIQWQFYVVPTGQLPSAKSISLATLKSKSEAVLWDSLKSAVEQARAKL